ncbi:MAG: TonB family protein [Sulfuritalea sp.]|nr:TonB family protein [Sulfuritalea sp.]
MDPPQRRLTLALAVSLFLHALLLSIRFTLPEAGERAREQALDVVLVNNRQATRPDRPQARAQANLDGGGASEAPLRARTPLPPAREERPGNDVVAAQQRVAELERQQRELLTQPGTGPYPADRAEPPHPADARISGRDLAASALAMVRLDAEIARSLQEYNQRPKRKFIGARVEEYRFAQYVEDWRQKVERVGNLNYPQAARGRLYGNLVLTVAIKSDGSIERVELNRSSGHLLLDEAAQRIVRLAAPFAVFPAAIRRDTDIIEITRTWSFTGADQLQTN